MDIFFNILKDILEEGFSYGILALGVFITYRVLDFPDLSVDGTVPLGAILSGGLILQGVNPWLSLLIAFCAGLAAGAVTGLLHVKLHIQPLLCGILVMTGLISVNLVLAMKLSGSSLVSFLNMPNVFTSFPASLIPEEIGGLRIRKAVVTFVVLILAKILLDLYLNTKSGLLLRAAGSNSQYVTMLARNPGTSKILGLALGNGFAALAGAVIAQQKETADTQMGTGMVVIGLASVIIGLSLFRRLRFIKMTTMVILGSILYKACLALALAIGLPTDYLKLLMAVLFTVALVASEFVKKGKFGKLSKGGLFRGKA